MIRHISIFFFREEVTAEEKESVRQQLISLRERLEGIVDYRVGTHCLPLPGAEAAEAPQFGELVQVIDFADRAQAEAYPHHNAHLEFLAATSACMKKVVAIDFVLADGRRFV